MAPAPTRRAHHRRAADISSSEKQFDERQEVACCQGPWCAAQWIVDAEALTAAHPHRTLITNKNSHSEKIICGTTASPKETPWDCPHPRLAGCGFRAASDFARDRGRPGPPRAAVRARVAAVPPSSFAPPRADCARRHRLRRSVVKIGADTAPTTAISGSNPETIIVRGHDLVHDLIGHISFTDHTWLLICGSLPSPAQRAMLDATLSPSPSTAGASVQTARMTLASAPEALQGAVAAGLLGCGSVISRRLRHGRRPVRGDHRRAGCQRQHAGRGGGHRGARLSRRQAGHSRLRPSAPQGGRPPRAAAAGDRPLAGLYGRHCEWRWRWSGCCRN